MNKWESDKGVEKVKVIIEIPKNTVAFVINILADNNGSISMTNSQYDSNDVEKLIKDSKKIGE